MGLEYLIHQAPTAVLLALVLVNLPYRRQEIAVAQISGLQP